MHVTIEQTQSEAVTPSLVEILTPRVRLPSPAWTLVMNSYIVYLNFVILCLLYLINLSNFFLAVEAKRLGRVIHDEKYARLGRQSRCFIRTDMI